MIRLRSRGSWASFGATGPLRSPSLRVTGALALIFFVLHLPFLPASLEDLDSVNFALGLHHFDVAQHQPHPPGYPLFIALGRMARAWIHSDAKALSVISLIAGTLSVFALVELFRRIEATANHDGRVDRSDLPLMATLLTGTAPLYWFTAVRPLSDMPGLAAALAVQALILRATPVSGVAMAAFLAAFASGIRSQVLWLTVPLLGFAIWRASDRVAAAGRAALAFVAGILAWAVPLVVLAGGLSAYWRAVFAQGAEDLSGIQMLWTTRTLRQVLVALNSGCEIYGYADRHRIGTEFIDDRDRPIPSR